MPHVVRCPHCASPFEFPDVPVCLCPGCGQAVSAPPLPPLVAQVAALPTRRRPPTLGTWFFSGSAVALVLFAWLGLSLGIWKIHLSDAVRIADGPLGSTWRHADGSTSNTLVNFFCAILFGGICTGTFVGLVVGLPAIYFKLRR